jgi:hypothetical protein
MLIMALWQFKITEAQGKTVKEQEHVTLVDLVVSQAVRSFVAG